MNGPCTGDANDRGSDATEMLQLLKNDIDDIRLGAIHLQDAIRRNGTVISDKKVKTIKRKNISESFVRPTSMNLTHTLIADYKILEAVEVALNNMTSIARNCTPDNQDHVIMLDLARRVRKTLCHVAILLRHQHYMDPIVSGEVPIVLEICNASDDSIWHVSNFSILEDIIKYTQTFYSETE